MSPAAHTQTDAPLPVGSKLGNYEVTGHLGSGGHGMVYEAKHRELGRKVAIKVPRDGLQKQVLEDARRMASLAHPHLVEVEHIEAHHSPPFLVLELLTGGSLDDRLEAAPGGLPLPEVKALAASVLEALAFSHERGIVHGDLKPSNLLFDAAGTVKVADFAIAAVEDQEVGLQHTLARTQAAKLTGTPLYMAPEQVDPRRRVGRELDGRADLFSFGKVLYEALTGPGSQAVRPPSMVRPGVDPAWDALVFQLLEDDPAARPASASEALAALAKLPSKLTTAQPPARESGRAAESKPGPLTNLLGLGPMLAHRDRGWLLAQAQAGAGIALGGLLGSLWLAHDPTRWQTTVVGWASLAALMVVACGVGTSLVASAFRRAAPPRPLDHVSAEFQMTARLPIRLILFCLVPWLIGVWLTIRPQTDAMAIFATGFACVIARRFTDPEARLAGGWPRLMALLALGASALAGAGAFLLQQAALPRSDAGISLVIGSVVLILAGVLLGGAIIKNPKVQP
ncbi:MAG: serine/threonine-protein kinase [Planctomycetota bacterium]